MLSWTTSLRTVLYRRNIVECGEGLEIWPLTPWSEGILQNYVKNGLRNARIAMTQDGERHGVPAHLGEYVTS